MKKIVVAILILTITGFITFFYEPADKSEVIPADRPLVERDEEQSNIAFAPKTGFDQEPENDIAGPHLHVAYPPAPLFYYYANSLFIFGSTEPYSRVDVTVNSEPVEIIDSRTGNFLTMIDIPRGEEFLIQVKATGPQGTTFVEKSVFYPAALKVMPAEPLAIHSANLIPAENQVLSHGENVLIAIQGSPGANAKFQIGSNSLPTKMIELAYPGGPPGDGGIYTAIYTVDEQVLAEKDLSTPLTVTVTLESEVETVSRQLPGKIVISASSPFRVVEVIEQSRLKNKGWLYIIRDSQFQIEPGSPGGTGYSANVVNYLVGGTRFEAVGLSGDYYRVKIDDHQRYLIHKDAVKELSDKERLKPSLSALELDETSQIITLRLKTTERFPILINDGVKELTIKLYGPVTEHPIVIPPLSGSVKSLSLEPCVNSCSACLVLTLGIDENMTGFQVEWDETDLILEIYKPQIVNKEQPLKGKTIIVDPGHGGIDSGAIGPGALHEKDVVLAMSLYLRDLLIAEGANVVMTRIEDQNVNLYDRPPEMSILDADLLISVHVNAHAHGARAVDIHGLMILYNYDHNKRLAEIMLDIMEERSSLPAFRTWRRNIAVLRHPQVPSVLVEAGYLMHPEDNWYILRPRGQKMLARAMLEGIKEYFLSLE